MYIIAMAITATAVAINKTLISKGFNLLLYEVL
jgi:hypothetical protein